MTITAIEIIDDSIRKNRIYRLQSELFALKEGEQNSRVEAQIYQINSILANIEKDRKEKNDDVNKLKDHKKEMKDAVYKVRWNSLTVDHRLNRLNEYLERTLVTDQKIIDRLIEMVKESELKSKDIEYKIDIGKIISIKILEAENGKFVLNDPKENTKTKSKLKTKLKSDIDVEPKKEAIPKTKSTKSVIKNPKNSDTSKSKVKSKVRSGVKSKGKSKVKARITKTTSTKKNKKLNSKKLS